MSGGLKIELKKVVLRFCVSQLLEVGSHGIYEKGTPTILRAVPFSNIKNAMIQKLSGIHPRAVHFYSHSREPADAAARSEKKFRMLCSKGSSPAIFTAVLRLDYRKVGVSVCLVSLVSRLLGQWRVRLYSCHVLVSASINRNRSLNCICLVIVRNLRPTR